MSGESNVNLQIKYDRAILAYVDSNPLIAEEHKPELLIAFGYFLEIKLSRRPRNKAQEVDIVELKGMSNEIYVGLLKVLDFEDDVIQAMWNEVVD